MHYSKVHFFIRSWGQSVRSPILPDHQRATLTTVYTSSSVVCSCSSLILLTDSVISSVCAGLPDIALFLECMFLHFSLFTLFYTAEINISALLLCDIILERVEGLALGSKTGRLAVQSYKL